MSYFKRITALLAALLFLQLPMGALAKLEVQILDEDDTAYFRQVTTFAGELPDELVRPLAAQGFAGYACYSGAMLESIPKEEADGGYEYTMALVALEKSGERILLGMNRNHEESWTMENLGSKALLPGREFSIVFSDIGMTGSQWIGRRFLIRYPRAGGETESYGFWLSSELWYVEAYEKVDAHGRGQIIYNEYPTYGFRVRNLPWEEFGKWDEYPAYVSFNLAHMGSITDFPTNAEAAKRIAEESWQRFEGTDLALCYGVNLREKATGASKILGTFNPGTLLHVLGQEKGTHAPWYHVRVGILEGWMSGMYVKFPKNADFEEALWHGPLPVAHTTDSRILRASPGNNAESIAELPTGTFMHVLATVEGGWLYVMVPGGTLGWEMDVDGTSGFLRADEVAQGASVDTIMP